MPEISRSYTARNQFVSIFVPHKFPSIKEIAHYDLSDIDNSACYQLAGAVGSELVAGRIGGDAAGSGRVCEAIRPLA